MVCEIKVFVNLDLTHHLKGLFHSNDIDHFFFSFLLSPTLKEIKRGDNVGKSGVY